MLTKIEFREAPKVRRCWARASSIRNFFVAFVFFLFIFFFFISFVNSFCPNDSESELPVRRRDTICLCVCSLTVAEKTCSSRRFAEFFVSFTSSSLVHDPARNVFPFHVHRHADRSSFQYPRANNFFFFLSFF